MRFKSRKLIGKIWGVTLSLTMAASMMFGAAGMPISIGNQVEAATMADGTVYYPEWKEYTAYVVGDLVGYNNKVYKCIYAHTSHDGWKPGSVPTLWEETDLSYVEAPTETPTEPPTYDPSNPVVVGKKTNTLLIGYYHTWHNPGNPFIKLRDVDKNWDVINISFAEPVNAGSTDGRMRMEMAGLSNDYTKEDFKADVKYMQSLGKKIVLSIGGYEGYFTLGSQAAVDQFVSDIKSFVDEYGFDGIDIDLEQSSINFDSGNDKDINNPKSPNLVNMITAVRTIVNSYGDDFILSWAPETYYVQMGYTFYAGINGNCDPRCGSYLPMINALREETTYVHVQLYNSIVITAPDGKTYSMGNKDATVAMCKMLLDGFYVGSGVGVAKTEATHFKPLRPDQVVIGVPSSAGAAGSGQIPNSELQAAFVELNNQYPGIRGIMTWSINWDNIQNNNSFARDNQAFLAQFRPDGTEKETTPEVTTPEVTTPEQPDIPVANGIEINGFQISTTVQGCRTIYSMESNINNQNVVSRGMIYSLSDKATEDDLYVGSNNKYVKSYEATDKGISNHNFSTSSTATSYAMTMKFGSKTVEEFSAEWRVRAYAELADGTYVYSKPATYTFYSVANNLYQNLKMNTYAAHNYLYTDILKVVNPNYEVVDFDWNNAIVGIN